MTQFDQRMRDLGFSILHEKERSIGDVEPRIQSIEAQIGSQIPSDYREFLTAYGGATFDELFEAPIIEPGHDGEYACPTGFLGFYQVKPNGSRHSLDLPDNIRYYHNRLQSNYIPIAQAIGGNLICLKIQGANAGAIYYWDHETEAVWLVAPSFADFISALAVEEDE